MFALPAWVSKHTNNYRSFEDIPQAKFDDINRRLWCTSETKPTVSIVIAAWNEEKNILNCISSLADLDTTIPFEIIVVNNNSSDKTQQILDKLLVRSLFQPIQGCGPARQMGQESALGKYILLADADCLYPPCWLDKMVCELDQDGVACVYGRYSFIPEPAYPRWKLVMLETMKDAIAELRHYKRPYLNAYGMSMGYVKTYGLAVGFVNHNIRGEDGRLCFDLMSFGTVKQMKSKDARVWTPPRTLQLEGSFGKAVLRRVSKEFRRLFSMFKPMLPHDTKTSKN